MEPMEQIDNEKLGALIARLRKERGLTQKELAQRLFVSDKAVSKWERGLSTPNVSLLMPLAEVLGVTVAELLKGERMEPQSSLEMGEVEKLVTRSVDLSMAEERAAQRLHRKKWGLRLGVCMAVSFCEIGAMLASGIPAEALGSNVILVALLMLIFGGWFCLLAKEKLPAYYDQNKISYITDGFVRLHMAGVCFNNSNWPHILTGCRVCSLAVAVLFPAVYWLVRYALGLEGQIVELGLPLAAVLSILVPIYILGKKYG